MLNLRGSTVLTLFYVNISLRAVFLLGREVRIEPNRSTGLLHRTILSAWLLKANNTVTHLKLDFNARRISIGPRAAEPGKIQRADNS